MVRRNHSEAVSPMRYLSAVAQSMPIFLVALIWGAIGIPVSWFASALVASVGLGIALGRYMSAKMVRGLLQGEGHFLCRRVPGGVWFFAALGLLGAVVASIILRVLSATVGGLILHVGGVVFGALCCTTFTTTTLVVLRLERAQGKHVCMGGPVGFYFDDVI
jgi:hypothetical protein